MGAKTMIANDTALYAAFKAKDARFDGRFFWVYHRRAYTVVQYVKRDSLKRKTAHFIPQRHKRSKLDTAHALYADQSLLLVIQLPMPPLTWYTGRHEC